MRIERQDDLMNPGFDPLGAHSPIGASRPNCGASITDPLGMSCFCPYCNTEINANADGRVGWVYNVPSQDEGII